MKHVKPDKNKTESILDKDFVTPNQAGHIAIWFMMFILIIIICQTDDKTRYLEDDIRSIKSDVYSLEKQVSRLNQEHGRNPQR